MYEVASVARNLALGIASADERAWWSDRSGLVCSEVTLTDQSGKEEADINEIVRRFGLTGELPQNYRPPLQADFVDVMDYQTAIHAVRDAEERFMQMPPELRARFDNDPQRVIDFIGDPANLDEVIKLGLAPPKKVVEPEPVKPA